MSNNNNSGHNDGYFYNPSIAAAAVFAVLFGILWAIHTFQALKYKTIFMIVNFIAVTMEVIGYVTRIISVHNWATGIVIISQTCLIVAPAFLAAQDYMIVGRMISYIGNEFSVVSHSKITKIFVGADIFAILTQAGGGAMLAGADGDISQMKNAKYILLAGLILQVITFGIFMFIGIYFDVKTTRAPELQPYKDEMRRLRKLWLAFYISSILITGRSIYRTAEFAEIKFTIGDDDPVGYALTHEWPMYAFDAVPIFFAIAMLALYHPGMFLPTRKGLRIDGSIEPQTSGCCGRRKPSPTGSVEVLESQRPGVPLSHMRS
ncbi:hypothetical protein FRB99_008993 [Tulasnella sp. 403]|nr:hypothetical protein FRB99_008993 [Tulasnella sp. 403]